MGLQMNQSGEESVADARLDSHMDAFSPPPNVRALKGTVLSLNVL